MSGALGLSPDALTTLGQYLSQIGVAANSRTGGGFLQAPSLGAAMSYAGAQLPQFEQQMQESRARQALEAAQTGQTQAQTEVTKLQIPFLQAWNQARVNYLNGGSGAPGAGGAPGANSPGVASIDPTARQGMLDWATQGTNVPAPILNSLVNVESGWNPSAVNPQSGAVGLGQILPSTAQSPGYGVPSLPSEALNDPRNNIRFAAHYLDGIGQKFGLNSPSDWTDPNNSAKVTSALNAYGGRGGTAAPTRYAASIMAGASQPMMQAAAAGMPGGQQPSTGVAGGQPQATGSFVPAGLPTPQQAFMDAQSALAQANSAARGAMLGFPGQDIAAQNWRLRAEQDYNYAYGSLKPQTFRPGGGGWSPAYGPMGMTQPTTVQLPGGQEQAAVQAPGFMIGGQYVTAPSITPLTYGGNSGGLTAHGEPANSYVARPAGGGGAAPQTVPGAPFVMPNGAPVLGPDGRPMLNTAAPAAGGAPPVAAPQPGAPVIKSIGPQQEEFLKNRGETLGEQFKETDEAATSAVQSNFLFDQMRQDSQTWLPGSFAEWKNDALADIKGIANTFGVATPNLDQRVADYQAFGKNAGMLLRETVTKVSSRASQQEFRMIGESLPNPETSQDGLSAIADEFQALNDYQIAKQIFMQQYKGDPAGFSVAANTFMSPSAFLINRMNQTADGQQRLSAMVARMSQTDPGRKMVQQLLNGYVRVKGAGYFDALDGKLGQAATSASAPPPAPVQAQPIMQPMTTP